MSEEETSVRRTRRNRGTTQRYKDFLAAQEEFIKENSTEETKNNEDDGNKEEENNKAQDTVLCLICGTTDENYNEEEDDREMIQCDNCNTWQHNECVLRGVKKIPKYYYCNVCDPENPQYEGIDFDMDPKPYIEKQLKRKKLIKSMLIADDDEDDDEEADEFKNDLNNVGEDDEDEEEDEDEDEEFLEKEDLKEEQKEDSLAQSRPKRIREPSRKSYENKLVGDVDFLDDNKTKKPAPKKRKSKQIDDITLKAREAVKKRFELMFKNLFNEFKDSIDFGVEEISKQSETNAIELEEELYQLHHDLETLKITKDYKEGCLRIYVNVKDSKNFKLRESIIKKQISYNKLVRLSVNELLNPDLKKEKEEAIRESMTLATFERQQVSNIRRTHKGDVLIENDNPSSSVTFDFNVGVSIDDEKLNKSESASDGASNDNDNNDNDDDNEPVYTSEKGASDNGDSNGNDDNYDHFTGTDNSNNHDNINGDDHRYKNISVGDDDDEFEKLLQDKVDEEEDSDDEYDPTVGAIITDDKIWEGQTIFIGVTNFQSRLALENFTFNFYEENIKLSKYLFDADAPIEIEGRLDKSKADDYISKLSKHRKFLLLRLDVCGDDTNLKNYRKLFNYYYSKGKYGIIKKKNNLLKDFVKEVYLIPAKKDESPTFNIKFENSTKNNQLGDENLFVLLIIKKEMLNLKEIFNQQQQLDSSFSFLANLNPVEMDFVNKIFSKYPETKKNSELLIKYLQQELTKDL